MTNGLDEEGSETLEEEDLGDPREDPDSDDENVVARMPDPNEEMLERAGATSAPACRAALTQATERFPNRSRISDGIMCDAAHPSTSDHCSGNAFDLTFDPQGGCDAHALVETLKQRRDPRVKYIISKRRIWNPTVAPDWRHYDGKNAHNHHAHVSILVSARDDTSPWWTGEAVVDPSRPDDWRTHPMVRPDERGEMVRHMQEMLIKAGHDLSGVGGADGIYGEGVGKELKAFQGAHGLTPDGKCGPKTWELLHP